MLEPLVLEPVVPVLVVLPVAPGILAAPVVKNSNSNSNRSSSAAVRAVVASRWAKCRRTPSKAAKS